MDEIEVMDVVSSAAAVLQLLGQAVSLVQQVYSARQAVKTAPKQLSDTEYQLFTLTETIEQVQNEPELHTPSIKAQLEVIYDISEELTYVLSDMRSLQERKKMYQGLYMLVKKTRYEGRLNDVMERLGGAKTELGIRIDVVHVGLTRRVGMRVERIEGMMARDWDGPTHKREESQSQEDGKKKKRKRRKETEIERERVMGRDPSKRFYHDLRVDDNVVEDNGTQMNGIFGFGEDETVAPSRASVVGNRASGKGQQRNFILGSGGMAELKAYGFGT